MNSPDKRLYRCKCISFFHDHGHHDDRVPCERHAPIMGGICNECRYWHTFPERRDNLG